MSSTTFIHLPRPSDPHPLAVSGRIQPGTGSAELSLTVIRGNDLHLLTKDSAQLRQIASEASGLADALDLAASHLTSKEASE